MSRIAFILADLGIINTEQLHNPNYRWVISIRYFDSIEDLRLYFYSIFFSFSFLKIIILELSLCSGTTLDGKKILAQNLKN